MIAPKNNLCPFHTRTLGRGMFAKTENVEVKLETFKTKEKDGKVVVGKYCPRCRAQFTI